MRGGRAVPRIRTAFFSGWNLFELHLPLLFSLLYLDFPFEIRSYVARVKKSQRRKSGLAIYLQAR